MKKNSRTSVALHALIHIFRQEGPITSEELAECLHTNPVVVRRVLGELRKSEIVSSTKGHGGGWVAIKEAKDVSFQDIFVALNESLLPSPLSQNDNGCCLVMTAITSTMDEFFVEAKEILSNKLQAITLEQIVASSYEMQSSHSSASHKEITHND